MSTKFTLAYGKDFHFYKECMDEYHLYLQLETTHFEAGYGRVLVEIPVHVWEVIRRRGRAEFDLADKSDDDLRQMIESKVDERIRLYRDAVAKGESEPLLAALLHTCAYGPADAPREQQVENGLAHYVARRQRQHQVRACIAELEQAQSSATLCEDDRL